MLSNLIRRLFVQSRSDEESSLFDYISRMLNLKVWVNAKPLFVGAMIIVVVMVLAWLIMQVFKVTDDASSAKGLALPVVSVAEIGEPDLGEGLKMLLCDGKYLFVKDPVDYVCTRWVSQGAFVVVELRVVDLRRLVCFVRWLSRINFWIKSWEELVEADLISPKVFGPEFLNERVTEVVYFEHNSDNC